MLNAVVIGQILWTSLATSSYYVLFAVAFSLVLRVNRIFNFTQAGVMTTAFYTAYASVQLAHWPGWLAFLASLAASLALAWATETLGLARLRAKNASVLFVFIFTFIVSELIAYLAALVFGTWSVTIFPSMFWPVVMVGQIAVSHWDIPAVLATAVCLAALFLFLRMTRWGQFMVAVADNPALAELYGIRTRLVYLLAMLIAAGLVAVGMFLYGTRAQIQPMTSLDVMLFAVVATIIGGIGNLAGAAIAAVALGIIQNASILVIPSAWQGFLLYIFLFGAIVFFPRGLRLPEWRGTRDRTRQLNPAPVE